MNDLETTSADVKDAYRQALEAAGVEFTERRVYRIEFVAHGAQAATGDESGDAPVGRLPGDGTDYRAVVEAIAQHPKEYVTLSDVVPEVDLSYDAVKGALSHIHHHYGVTNRRKMQNDGQRGRRAYGYRLKEAYRRELTGESVDVAALEEAQNA